VAGRWEGSLCPQSPCTLSVSFKPWLLIPVLLPAPGCSYICRLPYCCSFYPITDTSASAEQDWLATVDKMLFLLSAPSTMAITWCPCCCSAAGQNLPPPLLLCLLPALPHLLFLFSSCYQLSCSTNDETQ
jgi:hypothetical protein